MTGPFSLSRWSLACLVGEALGIAVVSTAFAAIDRGLVGQSTTTILAAGAWEGMALGTAQALVLYRIGIDRLSWIAFTIAGAVAGYGLSILGGAGSGGSSGPEPALWLMALLGAGLGIAMGLLMGALQGIAFKGTISIGRWALANAVGWAPAMAIIIIAAGLPDYDWELPYIAMLGAAAGALAGLCVGLVTAIPLSRAVASAAQGVRS